MKKTLLVIIFLVALVMIVPAYAEGGSSPPAKLIDLTPVFQAVIGLLAMFITAKVMPWIRAKISAQQQELLVSTVRILVYAAEQMFSTANGEEKLDYVVDELEQRGYKVDRAMIEAAVRDMNLWVPVTTVTTKIEEVPTQ